MLLVGHGVVKPCSGGAAYTGNDQHTGLYSAGAKGRGLKRRPLPLDPIPACYGHRKDETR